MRLVTFRIGNRPARAGALADGGRSVVQLAAPSVLAIVEGGQDALDRAAETLRRPPREALFPLADVTLLAPIPQPPQMRDFLCFEKHLQQAFAAVARLRGTEAAFRRSGTSGRSSTIPTASMSAAPAPTCPGPGTASAWTSSWNSAATSEDPARTS